MNPQIKVTNGQVEITSTIKRTLSINDFIQSKKKEAESITNQITEMQTRLNTVLDELATIFPTNENQVQ